MQKMSKDKIDEVIEVDGPDSEYKLPKWKVYLMKLEKLLKLRNFMMLAVIFYFAYVVIIPEALYIINVYDIHYFGYWNERAPRLASTTNSKLYYQR